jgi:hypothetical protein
MDKCKYKIYLAVKMELHIFSKYEIPVGVCTEKCSPYNPTINGGVIIWVSPPAFF